MNALRRCILMPSNTRILSAATLALRPCEQIKNKCKNKNDYGAVEEEANKARPFPPFRIHTRQGKQKGFRRPLKKLVPSRPSQYSCGW